MQQSDHSASSPLSSPDIQGRELEHIRERADSAISLIRAGRLDDAAVLIEALSRDIAALPWQSLRRQGRLARDLERLGGLVAAGRFDDIPALLRRYLARLERDRRRANHVPFGERLRRLRARPLRVLAWCAAVLLAAGLLFAAPDNLTRRNRDFAALAAVLAAYHRDHGAYPVSFGFDGAYSRYGSSRPDWIAGLVPAYLPKLPRDPRCSYDDDKQYLYMSDGKDYVLAAANPEDFEKAASRYPEMMIRPGKPSMYGLATTGTGGWHLLDYNPRAVDSARTGQRLRDLEEVKKALAAYRQTNGTYPLSQGFDGYRTNHGKSGESWIEGLAPDYLPALPRDPRNDADANNQYYYKSDGTDFKLIDHNAEDCLIVRRDHPDLIDPVRTCFAYGYWTGGAKSW